MATPTTDGHHGPVPFLPSRRDVVVAALLTIVVWTGTGLGLIVVISAVSSWWHAFAAATVAALPLAGVWSARWLHHALRLRTAVSDEDLARRHHGRLDDLADQGEPRALRPIGTTVVDVATRTGRLLETLLDTPSVRIFRCVRAPGQPGTPVTHAVAAGRVVVLVESVAWPVGQYELDADGRVTNDGRWIGQSVQPLSATVQYWRGRLPRDHRVSAVVVVHSSANGEVVLPRTHDDIQLVEASRCLDEIRTRLPGRPSVSRHAVAALLAAVR